MNILQTRHLTCNQSVNSIKQLISKAIEDSSSGDIWWQISDDNNRITASADYKHLGQPKRTLTIDIDLIPASADVTKVILNFKAYPDVNKKEAEKNILQTANNIMDAVSGSLCLDSKDTDHAVTQGRLQELKRGFCSTRFLTLLVFGPVLMLVLGFSLLAVSSGTLIAIPGMLAYACTNIISPVAIFVLPIQLFLYAN
ncbi:MAG: hypothetical protein K2X81_13190, partial [Candidatus Obscuribacterales bacterium]|nr:hypothetical protein [Candidatus Obscuribacterales bacterium]